MFTLCLGFFCIKYILQISINLKHFKLTYFTVQAHMATKMCVHTLSLSVSHTLTHTHTFTIHKYKTRARTHSYNSMEPGTDDPGGLATHECVVGGQNSDRTMMHPSPFLCHNCRQCSTCLLRPLLPGCKCQLACKCQCQCKCQFPCSCDRRAR